MEKEYKIIFTSDFCQYEEWAKKELKDHSKPNSSIWDVPYWRQMIEDNPEKLAICKKWKGKSIKLSQLPRFIEEVGEVVLSNNEVEVYNNDRE